MMNSAVGCFLTLAALCLAGCGPKAIAKPDTSESAQPASEDSATGPELGAATGEK